MESIFGWILVDSGKRLCATSGVDLSGGERQVGRRIRIEDEQKRSRSGGEAEEKRRESGGKAEGNVRAMAQDGRKSFQRRPVRSQDALKTPPRRPQDALRDPKKLPGGPQVGPKTRFWEIFKPKMQPSWHQIRIQKRSYGKTA